MNQETQLKLQAYLDGELSAVERQEVETLLRQDAGAKDLLTELSQTTTALSGHEGEIKLPESREFYWSKIQREINRSPEIKPAASFSLASWLRRGLVTAGAAAALVVAVLLSLPHTSEAGDYFFASGDAVAFTYRNYNTGTTLVWLDFSSENDFSDVEMDDTLEL